MGKETTTSGGLCHERNVGTEVKKNEKTRRRARIGACSQKSVGRLVDECPSTKPCERESDVAPAGKQRASGRRARENGVDEKKRENSVELEKRRGDAGVRVQIGM